MTLDVGLKVKMQTLGNWQHWPNPVTLRLRRVDQESTHRDGRAFWVVKGADEAGDWWALLTSDALKASLCMQALATGQRVVCAWDGGLGAITRSVHLRDVALVEAPHAQ